jgi:hypothetical protein
METAQMTNCLSESAENALKWSSKHTLTTVGISLILGFASGIAPAQSASSKTPATEKAADKTKPAEKAAPKTPEPVIENVQNVTPEQLVDKPHEYLNKNIKFTAAFHSFTNVGLDYKPALRQAKTNLSFFVLRQGTHVPLSELKLDMPIPKEKDPENQMLAQLKDGDTVEVTGHVFSTALDDPWVDVLRLKKIASAPEEKKVASDKEKKEKDSAENPTPEQKPTGPKDGTKLELKTAPDSKKTPEEKKPDSTDK